MLVPALLQTSLVLWLAQQTLQGGVRPQSVSWGRVLPAQGVGVGVQPGVAGALGAMGNRYGTKAMKTGVGRYSGAQLGVGGYRSYGLGSRAGLRQGGYGAQGAYGAALGTGMGTGHTNGLGYGQGGKRGYGAGLGTVPGYGALAGNGYHGTRPGVSAADLGGPQMANLGQASQDLKREKSRAFGPSYGDTTQAGMPNTRRSDVPTDPYLQEQTGFRPAALPHGREIKSLDLLGESSSRRPLTPLDRHSNGLGVAASQARGGEGFDPAVLERRRAANHAAALAAMGARPSLPPVEGNTGTRLHDARDYDPTVQQNQQATNCGSTRDLLDMLGIPHQEQLGSETQRTRGPVLQPQVDKDGNPLGRGERTHQRPLPQTQDGRGNSFPLPPGQGTSSYLSAIAEDLGRVAKDKSGPRIRGTVAVDRSLRAGGSHGPVIPGERGTQSLGIAAVEGHEAKTFTPDGQKVKHLSLAERDVRGSKASIPGQTGRNDQATSYIGGPGNYPGAGLGAGGYGPGLGQGAYLGAAAGKHAAAAGLGQGYGDGATGYLGHMAGNGYGYGNGYNNGHGAGLGYPSELADGAENKSGKREALGAGGYAGQVQGAYGALGAGLDTAGGKYGGAQVPYGNAPVIPTGLEGNGGYPYPAQQLNLGAEGAKTASKYGYGGHLGATQDALREQAGQYGEVNGALGNGYKGVNKGM